jgi:hypothetical protein
VVGGVPIAAEAAGHRALGRAIAGCGVDVAGILRTGAGDGSFAVEHADPRGTHSTRIRVGAGRAAPGTPALFTVASEQLVRTCVAGAPATVGAQPSS